MVVNSCVPVRSTYAAEMGKTKTGKPAQSARKAGVLAGKAGKVDSLRAQARAAMAGRDFSRAVRLLEKAVRQDSAGDSAGLFAELGLARLQAGDNRAAIRAFDRALVLGAEDAGIHNGIGLACQALGEVGRALTAFEHAVAAAPGSAGFRLNLANAYKNAGRAADARAALRAAQAIAPDSAAIIYARGNIEAAAGDAAAAVAAYAAVLDIDPGHINAFYGLGQGIKAGIAVPDRLIARFAARADDPAIPPAGRGRIHHVLAMQADAAGDFAQARLHFDAFNRYAAEAAYAARSQGQAFSPDAFPDAFKAEIDAIIAASPAGSFARQPQAETEGRRPLFIIGMPRSGTTLVEGLLARHRAVTAGGELAEMALIAEQAGGYPAALRALPEKRRKALAARYRARLTDIDPDAAWVSDKMPVNFLHLGLIARLFPDAVILHCQRDARDVVWSCYTQNFTGNLSWSYRLADIAAFYRGYRRLMAHWRQVLPLPVHDIVYEDLVAAPETGAKAIFDHLGLEWHDELLARPAADYAPVTASSLQQGRRIDSHAVGRWRPYADALAGLDLDVPD